MIRATFIALVASATIASTHAQPQHRPLTNQEMQISYLCVQSPKGHAMRRNFGTAIAVEVCNCFGVASMTRLISQEILNAHSDPALERIEDRLLRQCSADIEEMHKPLLRD
jgi:hypothetical protein